MRKIKLIESKSELGAGRRGASIGIDALKMAAINSDNDFFHRYPREVIPDENELIHGGTEYRYAKYADGILKVYERLSARVRNAIDEGYFPIVLTGDHSNGGGSIAGVKCAYPEENIGVIWIDAHADLHTPYTTPSGNMHGMPLATAIAEDNLECRRNNPNEDVSDYYWDRMKEIGGISPKLKPEHLLFIALRDYEPEEAALLDKYSIPNITTEEVREIGPVAAAQKALDYLKDCTKIYITFDVDSMDSTVSLGTGTPVPCGLMPAEASGLLYGLVQDKRVCCLEVTEVNPILDCENRMATTAFKILERTVAVLEEKKHAF